MEKQTNSETQSAEIETTADSMDSSAIYHIINDLIGFVLYMHQQIPNILQNMSVEYEMLRDEYKEMEVAREQCQMNGPLRRKHNSRMREVKQGTRRLDKLMNAVNSVQTALRLMVTEVSDIQTVVLVLGASPLRPLYVYEVSFSCGKVESCDMRNFTKTRAAEGLCRKAIRTLVSKGAGSLSYPGPSKLFLLVKAPSSVSLPLHFLPKREFRYSKKIAPFRLHIKCRTQNQERDAASCSSQTGTSALMKPIAEDLMWFQCRHVIKGLANLAPTEE